MNRDDLRDLCARRMLVCASPLGLLATRESSALPERMALDEFEALVGIHRSAIAAGAAIVLTNTFAANAPALEPLGLRDALREILRRAVQAAAQAIEEEGRTGDGTPLLGVTLGPLPVGIEPRGALRFEQAIEVYREAAQAVLDLTPDLFVLESFGDLRNLKAALIALREAAPEVPVAALMTFGANGRTEAGASPAVVWAVARSLGAEIVGASGGVVPEAMLPVLAAFQTVSDLPLMLQPSTIVPGAESETVLEANDFLRSARPLIERGPSIVGVSGPYTPEWLQGLTRLCRKHEPKTAERSQRLVVTGTARDVEIGTRRGVVAVGEWPASRGDAFRAARDNRFNDVIESLQESARSGVQMLEVRSTLPQIEEPAFLAELLPLLEDELHLPLLISADTRKGLETALRAYAGRPLVSAVWDEAGVLERVLPLAARYGAAVVAVCHTGGEIPRSAEDRLAVAERLLQAALSAGLRQEDLIFDPVALGAVAEGDRLRETLRALALIKENLGQPTMLRLSRVSDDLPVRSSVEAAFMAMAAAAGLDMAVLNGANPRLVDAALTVSMLAGRDREARRFLKHFAREPVRETAAAAVGADRAGSFEEQSGVPVRVASPRPREREDRERPPRREWQPDRGRPDRREGGDARDRRAPDRGRTEEFQRSARPGFERERGDRPPERGRFERERGDRPPERGRFERERGDRPPERGRFERERGDRPPERGRFDRERGDRPERGRFDRERGDRPERGRFERERGDRPPERGRFDRERGGRSERPPFHREERGPGARGFEGERQPRRQEPFDSTAEYGPPWLREMRERHGAGRRPPGRPPYREGGGRRSEGPERTGGWRDGREQRPPARPRHDTRDARGNREGRGGREERGGRGPREPRGGTARREDRPGRPGRPSRPSRAGRGDRARPGGREGRAPRKTTRRPRSSEDKG
jgi:5-methyltetrahydrofolate--homocysteine methyltransferase